MATQVVKSKRRTEWVRRVKKLMDEIESWARQEKWSIHRTEKEMDEESIGKYSLPSLHLRAPGGELYVTPVALDVIGGEGRVDVEAWPSLNRVKLLRNGKKKDWLILTDSNVPLRVPWTRKSFVQLVRDLQT